jgi:hypothetical protein
MLHNWLYTSFLPNLFETSTIPAAECASDITAITYLPIHDKAALPHYFSMLFYTSSVSSEDF